MNYQYHFLEASISEFEGWGRFCHVVYPSGTPEDFRFCVVPPKADSKVLRLHPRRLDSEALRRLQRWGKHGKEKEL